MSDKELIKSLHEKLIEESYTTELGPVFSYLFSDQAKLDLSKMSGPTRPFKSSGKSYLNKNKVNHEG